MKQLMSVLFIAILFASCSSDDDNSSNAAIVGSWTLVELNAESPRDYNNDGTVDRNVMNEIPCYEGHSSFTADGNYLLSLSRVEEEEIDGVIVFTCNGNIIDAGTYVLNGNQLTTTTNSSNPQTSTITLNFSGDTVSYSIDSGGLGILEFVLRRD